jgi:hypothetical protein
MNVEPKLELTTFATDPEGYAREIDKIKELTAVCEQPHFEPYQVLDRYLGTCGFISGLLKNFDTDEAWLSTREQTESVRMMRGSIASTRESVLRAVAAVECRLISAGALGQPGCA